MEGKVLLAPLFVKTELPVFVCDLSPLQVQLDLARQAIEELKQTHPQGPASNVHACYMSPWNSHHLNAKLRPICDSVALIAQEAAAAHLSAALDRLKMELVVTDCWGIDYADADYTDLHHHFPAEFGCAIYLEADEHCAPIVFARSMQVQPRTNSLLLFPGILPHAVPANAGRRVVLSMNLNKRATFAVEWDKGL